MTHPSIESKQFEEAELKRDNSFVLIQLWPQPNFKYSLIEGFYGTIITIDDTNSSNQPLKLENKTIFLCGDITKINQASFLTDLNKAHQVHIVRELSHGYDNDHLNDQGPEWSVVGVGRLPVLVHGVGVLYRQFFDVEKSTSASSSSNSSDPYFKRIHDEHAFQTLTESNKPNIALRTGIYLTPVEKEGDDTNFHLLRCSSNFSGPTVDFGKTDHDIVKSLNNEAACLFDNPAPLNHVLAQVYHNHAGTNGKKQAKAKIKAHSDKTKDMPSNGIMAFCTFYDRMDEKMKPMVTDPFDRGYKGRDGKTMTSALTKLNFQIKPGLIGKPEYAHLTHRFDVTLYPDSVFFMPLSTNRLYTHEIVPSNLDVSKNLPTRMGYVVRCSNTRAVHRDGKTLIQKRDGSLVDLQQPTPEGMKELRAMYAEENRTENYMDYGDKFLFSMNRGDYMKPICSPLKEFRSYTIPFETNLFEELSTSAPFEGKGNVRYGAVLTKPNPRRGYPIVRTTSEYTKPAQCFAPIHESLSKAIQTAAGVTDDFNNALIEKYNNGYRTMGFHSDLAMDLQDQTHIALFSCYERPDLANPPPRKLIVESKDSGGTFEIPLHHNSLVVFSLETNSKYRHKIVLDNSWSPPENQWLGVTFRVSKTFVQYHRDDGKAYLENGQTLELAERGQENRKLFFKLRGQENKESRFNYPPGWNFTVSESDLMEPTPAGMSHVKRSSDRKRSFSSN